MANDKKWAVMGGIALNVEYTRKYGFEASAAARVTAKLVAVPPPSAFQEAVQASIVGRAKRLQLSLPADSGTTLVSDGSQSIQPPRIPPNSMPPGSLAEPTPSEWGDDLDSNRKDKDLEAKELEQVKIIPMIEVDKANVAFTFDDRVRPPQNGIVDSDGLLTLQVAFEARTGVITFADDGIPVELIFDEAMLASWADDGNDESVSGKTWNDLQDEEIDVEIDSLSEDEEESVARWRFPGKIGIAYSFNDGIGPEQRGIVPEDGFIIQEYSPKATAVTLRFEGDPRPFVINVEE